MDYGSNFYDNDDHVDEMDETNLLFLQATLFFRNLRLSLPLILIPLKLIKANIEFIILILLLLHHHHDHHEQSTHVLAELELDGCARVNRF